MPAHCYLSHHLFRYLRCPLEPSTQDFGRKTPAGNRGSLDAGFRSHPESRSKCGQTSFGIEKNTLTVIDWTAAVRACGPNATIKVRPWPPVRHSLSRDLFPRNAFFAFLFFCCSLRRSSHWLALEKSICSLRSSQPLRCCTASGVGGMATNPN